MITLRTLAALGVCALPTHAQDSIDAIFPDSSYAVLRFGGLDRCRKTAQQMPLFRLVRQKLAQGEFDLASLANHELRHFKRDFGRAVRDAGLKPDDLRTLLGGEMALGVGRPTLAFFGAPSLLLAIETKGREEKVVAVLDRLERNMSQGMGSGITWTSERFDGVEILKVAASRLGIGGMSAAYAHTGGYLLLGTGTAYLKDCLRTMKQPGRSIRRSTTYTKGVELLRGQPLLSMFLNCKPLGQMAGPVLPYEAQDLGRALGIEQIEGLYWGAANDRGAGHDLMLAGMPGNAAGLLKSAFSQPTSCRAAKLCPRDTAAFASIRCDARATIKAAGNLLQHLPPGAGQAINQAIQEASQPRNLGGPRIGLTRDDLILLANHLGSEFSLAVTMNRGTPGALLFAELKDPEAAQEDIVALLSRVFDGEHAPRLRQRKSKGIWFISQRGWPVTPALAFRDGMMIVSPFIQNLDSTIVQLNKGEPMLAMEKAFREARQSMGRASVFGAAFLGRIAKQVWTPARGIIENALNREGLDGEALLPTADELASVVGTLTGAGITDQSGFLYQEHSPFGTASVLAIGGWGLDWLLKQGLSSR
ncbi:MAG: hypothetical protein CMJ85_06120 [Planctomycetes bacterium]|nr:hypothetical protein [Planctomycetota bacterium]MDP6425001.1 hypothetical protein [Planctomycetota bacterium]